MAKAQGGLGDGLRGKIDGLSFYTMKGVEGTIVRRSSGHTKEKKNTDPKLRNFKLAGEDFSGRARMSKFLMGAFAHQKPMADYNIAGPLIALMKPVQELDGEGDYGARNVKLTAYPHVIKGFSFNKNNTLDTVIRFPVTGTIDRETLSAKVQFPELVPGINFAPSVKQPYYAFRISLAVVPDIIFNQGRHTPTHPDYPINCAKSVDSEWFSLQEGSKALEMEVNTIITPPDTNFTLILVAGILYGELKALERIGQVRHAGSAKVLEVG
jgi:hypothetical protein